MTTPTPEDKLSAMFREEAESIRPAGDGLQKIQKRVAAKRRTRWVLPGALVATAAAASFVFVLSDNDGQSALKQNNPPGSSTEPTAPEPTVTPTTAGGGLDHPLENPAIWPFTTSQEIADWKTTYPYAGDKTALVQHYLKDALSLDGTFTLTKPCESCDVVDIGLGGHKVGQAALERFDVDGDRVYTISTIGETDLKLLTPGAGDAVSSPTKVRGTIAGVDENVRITLTDSAGGQLGTTTAPAGSAVPWEGSVRWSATGWVHGAVVLTTFSMKDGTLNRLTVVPVTRGDSGTAAPTGSTFVGIRAGRVDLFDDSGAFVKHLTYPKSPDADTEAATSDTGSVFWLRQRGTECHDALIRLDNGVAQIVVPAGQYKLSNPQISPDGQTVAYNRDDCAGKAGGAIVVTGPSGTRTFDYPADQQEVVGDVANDGALLYGPAFGDGGLFLMPAGATTYGDHDPVFREESYPTCGVGAAAFDGAQVVAMEKCSTYKNRVVRFDLTGKRLSTGVDLDVQIVTELSVREGKVLIAGTRRDDTPFQVFVDPRAPLTPLDLPAGVHSADW